MFYLSAPCVKGEPDGIASFHRLIPGLCNTGGAYPPVVHSDTFCYPRSIFPGRYSAKFFTFGNMLVYFCNIFFMKSDQNTCFKVCACSNLCI